MKKIQILLNGESHQLESPLLLKNLLTRFKIDSPYIAVVVNDEIIPRSETPQKAISDGDIIEVIRPVAGG